MRILNPVLFDMTIWADSIYISEVFQGFVYHHHLIVTEYLCRTLELSVEACVASGATSA